MTRTRPASCRTPRLPRSRRARPASRRDAVTGWEDLQCAVALLTAQRGGDWELQAALTRSGPPERLITGLQVVASAALAVLMPDDDGTRALEVLGLLALERGAER